ncbi:non-canonical purine NTP diphosphatase [Eudoraea chungangensis]|uniref:non-canonical purine NTP diphosphatase n=1 Tax=Eudoraea chungangensis TaxID=1481905 RepID=UPI0023ED5410|nr:non-canonical purine NTP diphosphatase [Eudoraea chungangensis]
MKLVFATQNRNKIKEVKLLLPSEINIISLAELHCHEDIPETADTLDGNAQLKAEFVWNKYALGSFADDTGLLIDALNGAPGVYSARYAGLQATADDNIDKVLHKMKNKSNRAARFITSIALNLDGSTHFFKGIIEGQISKERMGKKGFGYDPIFIPKGYQKSFAQMTPEEKNSISHRGRALEYLNTYLRKTL